MSLRYRLAVPSALALAVLLEACSLALDFDATSKRPAAQSNGFCGEHQAPPAVFCDDFDGEPLVGTWPAVEQANGSAQNDDDACVSPPSSLLSSARPAPAGADVRAISSVGFSQLAGEKLSLRIAFALRVERFDATNGAESVVFDLLYGAEDDFNQLALELVSTETAVSLQLSESVQKLGETDGEYVEHGPLTQPRLGQWIAVGVELDIHDPNGTGNALRVTLDGKKALDTELMLALSGGAPRVELGVGWVDTAAPTRAWAVRYDDFLVEASPLE